MCLTVHQHPFAKQYDGAAALKGSGYPQGGRGVKRLNKLLS